MDQEDINQMDAPNNEMWRMVLDGEVRDCDFKRRRIFLNRLPSNRRCKLCSAPFGGIGGLILRLFFNYRPSNKNPNLCNSCETMARTNPGGAEAELSLLFADVRGSTALAEKMSPAQFSGLLNRFYKATSEILVASDAIIDKLVGDEVIGLFLRGIAGQDHAKKALQAAERLLEATGQRNPEGPWIPIGIGVHTGTAFVGSVGSKENFTDFTALGDSVNVTARLAERAGAGEILTSEASLRKAGRNFDYLEKRSLQLKGKSMPFDVWVIKS